MTSSADLSSAPATEPPPPRRATWAALRPLVLRLHFYAGLLVAPFLLVAATTGFLYAASVQIEKIPAHGGRRRLPAPDGRLPGGVPRDRRRPRPRART
ncbi:PepSY domain-containing protein [Nonomuraea deserti]|uniref:PepSY domain-containing protein n=1 Tax=Nonomuraea deserti TaxID=1848322 RepID=UPI001C70ADD3|nr:PepSY domain-containing protein [Nonomuraea deserti]